MDLLGALRKALERSRRPWREALGPGARRALHTLSAEALDILDRLMDPDEGGRMAVEQAADHPWCRRVACTGWGGACGAARSGGLVVNGRGLLVNACLAPAAQEQTISRPSSTWWYPLPYSPRRAPFSWHARASPRRRQQLPPPLAEALARVREEQGRLDALTGPREQFFARNAERLVAAFITRGPEAAAAAGAGAAGAEVRSLSLLKERPFALLLTAQALADLPKKERHSD